MDNFQNIIQKEYDDSKFNESSNNDYDYRDDGNIIVNQKIVEIDVVLKMIMMEEVINVPHVGKHIYLILHSIHILKQNMIFKYQDLVKVEEDLKKT